MTRIKVSVVVPTRNRANLLLRLLTALDQQEIESYEVIVVDDNSNDATPHILQNWSDHDRIWFRLEENVGSYGARNEGWRRARGGIVAFTDDDCVPEPGWLSALVRAFDDSEVVGVQGATIPTPGVITPFTHQIEQTSGGPPYRTCNIAYRRHLLEDTSGFDASLRWYADNLQGLQMRRLGRIGFAADAIVHHPPRPKEWRSPQAWLARFDADAGYRPQLRELEESSFTIAPRILPVMLWLARPLVKQALPHSVYAVAHPSRYFREVQPMLVEKRELFSALLAYWIGRPEVIRKGAWPALSSKPRVSAIVVTRGRPEMLADTLSALTRQTWRNTEIIVVDHDPSCTARDVTCAVSAVYVHAPCTTLGQARQRGVEVANGKILAFTDDDCLPASDWIEKIVEGFRECPGLAGLQGRTTSESGLIGTRSIEVNRPNALYHTCNIAYRTEAVKLVQGFDMRFIRWFEDTALAARVLSVAGPIGWEPGMVVRHRAVPRLLLSDAQWRDLIHDEYLLHATHASFYRRNRGPKPMPVLIARWLIGSTVKALLRDLPKAPMQPIGYLRTAKMLLTDGAHLLKALSSARPKSKQCHHSEALSGTASDAAERVGCSSPDSCLEQVSVHVQRQ